ncbi:MAG: hypothetical protein HY833_02925 [Candidatus Aenigmarchaeota archaeon]|nr:hypothetical protein [Candidatus Aenigmarchaeota archaeon]
MRGKPISPGTCKVESMKGASALVSAVLVMLISVVAVSVVIAIGLPALDRAGESNAVSEAQRNMLILDGAVRQTASEGAGIVKEARLSITGGSYRANPEAGTLEYDLVLESDLFPSGVFRRDGSLSTSVSGSASASQNSTHLIIENGVLEAVFPKIGSETSFAAINTSDMVRTIRFKDGSAAIAPNDTSIKIGNLTSTSWGTGYTKVAREGSALPKADVLAHVRSSQGAEYEVLYSLRGSADFLTIDVLNTSMNETTMSYAYKIGSSNADVLRFGDNSASVRFDAGSNVSGSYPSLLGLLIDNTNYTRNSSTSVFQIGSASSVLYNASDGSLRDVRELLGIGQGSWNYTSNSTHTTVNYTLAGSDGYEFGVRDSRPGGSYWLDENGSLYGIVNISNDFIRVGMTERNMTVYNSSNKIIFNASFDDAVKVDRQDMISTYGAGTQNKTVYFYDWSGQKWVPWQKGYGDSKTVAGENLGLWWKFNEISGNATDSSGNANTATVTNVTRITNSSCRENYGYCLSFDGVGNSVKAPDSASLDSTSNPLTIGVWIKPRALPSNDWSYIMQKEWGAYNSGYHLRMFSSSGVTTIYYGSYQNDESFVYTPTINSWTHLAVVYKDNATRQLYIDGNLVQTAKSTSGNNPTAQWSKLPQGSGSLGAFILGNEGSGYYNFNGLMDGVKVWHKALTPDEILAEYRDSNVPDWLDSRNKQAFKWRYSFSRAGSPVVNYTYLMTAHDPFVRIFVDSGDSLANLREDFSSYSSQSQADSIWIPADSNKIRVNKSTESAYFMGLNDGTNDNMYFDYGRNVGNIWTMRFRTGLLTSSAGVGAGIVIGISSTNTSASSTQDGLFLYIDRNGGRSYRSFIVDDSTLPGSQLGEIFYTFVDNTEYWWELKRENSTAFTFTLFSDKYRTVLGRSTVAVPSTVRDLRYIKILNVVQSQAGWMSGNVDDLEFYEDTSNVSSYSNTTISFSLPENRTSVTTAEPGLVGYWNFNEGRGTNITDSSGNGNTERLYGGTSWVSNSSCKFGGCVSFDGSGDYINGTGINFELSGRNSASYSIWVKSPGANSLDTVIMYSGNSEIGFSHAGTAGASDHKIYFGALGSSVTTNTLFNDNAWHHVVGTYDGTTMRVYVDGIEEAATSRTGSFTSNGNYILFAVRHDAAASLRGELDEARVYNRALSPSEIRQLYLTGLNQQKPGVYFTKNNATDNEEVLFATTNFKNVNRTSANSNVGTASNFQIFSNHTNFFGFNYTFNSTMNQNFMFALGTMGRMNTTVFNPQNNYSVFSNELIESIANSTMTYYDLFDGSLVGWWRFNEGGGTTAYDSTGNNNTATLTSSPTWITNSSCKNNFGSCISFDGSNDYIEVNNTLALNMTQDFTMEVWFRTTVTSAGTLVSKNIDNNAGYQLLITSGGHVSWLVQGGDNSNYHQRDTSANYADGNWHHAVGVARRTPTGYGKDSMSLYVDGVESTSTDTIVGTINNINCNQTCKFRVGSTSGGSVFFNGMIDNLKAYSRALSQDEIRADYLATIDNYPNFGTVNQTNGATSFTTPFFMYDGGAAGIWRFDEGSGLNATDASGNGNTGTLLSGPAWISNSSCKYGGCIYFDGSNDYINAGNGTSLNINNKISLEAWIKSPGAPSIDAGIIDKGGYNTNGYALTHAGTAGSDDHMIYFALQGNAAPKTRTVFNDNIWHHVVGTYDGSVSRIYVDGIMESQYALSVTLNPNPTNLIMGARGGVANFFNGYLDEVRIYPRALTDTEIREHYQREVTKYYDDFGTATYGKTYRYFGVEDSNTTLQPVTPAGTVLHYRFNDNSTLNATDASGNNITGSVVNGAAWISNTSCMASFGGCMSFDDSNDYVQLGNISNWAWMHKSNSKFTINTWFKKRGATKDYILDNKDDTWANVGIGLESNTDGTIDYEIANGNGAQGLLDVTSIGKITDDEKWHMLTVTYDNNLTRGNARVFFDGGNMETYDKLSFNPSSLGPTYNLDLGRARSTGFLGGMIDDLIIVNRSLSPDEVYQLYLGGAQRHGGDLVGWWKFNDADLPDISFNYSSSGGWTQVGSGVAVSNGQVTGFGADAVESRVWYDLGRNLSNTRWVANFEFRWTASNIPSHRVFWLTNDSQDVYDTASGDGIGVNFGYDGADGNRMHPEYIDNGTDASIVTGTTLSSSTTYYMRVERLNATAMAMSVFSDPQRSTLVGSVTRSVPATIQNLRYLQHANGKEGSGSRTLTATIDNMRIYDGSNAGSSNATFIYSNYTLDSSGNGNTGNLTGGVHGSDDKLGNALRFDGMDDYVKVENSPSLNHKSLTVSAWTKRLGNISGNANQGIAGKEDVTGDYEGYMLFWDGTTPSIRGIIYNGSTTQTTVSSGPGTIFPLDTWVHATLVVDDVVKNVTLYVNGTRVSSASFSGTIQDDTGIFTIGARSSSPNDATHGYLNGTVDNVKVWKRALTSDEVMHEYVQTQDSESIYGRIHRVASADGIQSVSFNLTDHNSTFEGADYDMRALTVNGSTSNSSISAAAPSPGCFNITNVTRPYACSYDDSEFSQAKASGIIGAGRAQDFSSICFEGVGGNQTGAVYKFNLTAAGPLKTIIPFSTGDCGTIGNGTGTVFSQGVPAISFGSYLAGGPSNLQMVLQYDRIKILGDLRMGPGLERACFKKIGQDGPRILINATNC